MINNSPRGVIIGFGVVGKTTARSLGIPYYVDIDERMIADETLKVMGTYILCLPTPTVKGKQDLSAIYEWLKWVKKNYKPPTLYDGGDQTKDKKPLVILRSTILPGATKVLQEKYPGIDIVHVPEFLTMSTAMKDAKNPELLVIGTDDLILREVVQNIFKNVKAKKTIYCSPTTAELIKYTMNSFFTLKVVFGNHLWDVAKETGANYDQVVEAIESHKWGAKNGWNIWQGGFRGYSGKCLTKDIEAFIHKFRLPLLETMHKVNKKLVKETK